LNRKAVIDVGSNSIKLLVAEKGEGGALATVFDDITVSRLGAGLSKGKPFSIQPEAMERNCRVICDYVKRARAYGAEDIVAVGTMALRRRTTGRILSAWSGKPPAWSSRSSRGQEEAQLVLSAVLSSFGLEEKTAIFDTGGGSTELIFLQRGKITKKISIPLGCLGITAGYYAAGVVGKPCLEAALHEIDSVLKGHGVDGKPDLLIGVGGTVTTMAAVKHRMLQYNPRVIQGSSLTRQEVEDQIALYASLEETERRKIPGLPAERADLILGGACIVRGMMERLAADALKVSDRGIRHGILYELFRHD
jgi:exopolyphosphatase / guanosine-5'-triphosphate,3'-diphosphate pyrophosphatase